MKRVGVLRKAVDFQVPLGGGAFFSPFGRRGGQGDQPLPMRARDSRSGEQMQEAKQRMLESQQVKLLPLVLLINGKRQFYGMLQQAIRLGMPSSGRVVSLLRFAKK
mgnify:CR=1 FL=1